MDSSSNEQLTEPQGVVLNPDNGKHSPVPNGTGKSLFEILAVVIIIVLFLGILNYFNILPLSSTFPNPLGFLPHMPSQQSQRSNNLTITPTPTSTANYSPNVFQYDTEKAKTILDKYIKDNIKPEFLPENIDIKQGLSIDNRMDESLKHLFGSYLINSNETIAINFHFKEGTNTPNDYVIFIQPSKTGQTSLNSTLTNSLASSYFINPFPIENCNTKGTTMYCETFKTKTDGKRGFGAIIAQDPSKSPPKPTLIIFTCFIPKESKDYDSMKSCISP